MVLPYAHDVFLFPAKLATLGWIVCGYAYPGSVCHRHPVALFSQHCFPTNTVKTTLCQVLARSLGRGGETAIESRWRACLFAVESVVREPALPLGRAEAVRHFLALEK